MMLVARFVTAGVIALVAVAAPPGAAAPQQLTLDPSAWRVDSQNSGANFAVRHMLVSTVRGQLGPITGTVWYDGKDVSSIRADIIIDVKKLNTGNNERDTHLRTDDFFNVDRYPTITFKSKRIVPGDPEHFKMVGDLKIRDVTKEVTLDVEGPAAILRTSKEQRTAATATTTVNRFDYGLRWNALIETGGAVVASDVKITIDLQITRNP